MSKTAQWYENLVKDCKTILTDSEIESKRALVRGYHQVGERILKEKRTIEKLEIPPGEIVSQLQESLGKSESTIWRSVQFAKKYPKLENFPDPKASWHRVYVHYLPKAPVQVTTVAQEQGLESKADFSTVKKLVMMVADLSQALDSISTKQLDPDAVDYLCSELKITTGKSGKFLLQNDRRSRNQS